MKGSRRSNARKRKGVVCQVKGLPLAKRRFGMSSVNRVSGMGKGGT